MVAIISKTSSIRVCVYSQYTNYIHTVAAWLSGSALVSINEATLIRRVRLVLGWVTVCGQVNHLGLLPATHANSAFYPQRDGE